MTDVYLHVGVPKTGTTSIQRALTERASDLAAAGVLVPGGIAHRAGSGGVRPHRPPEGGRRRSGHGAFERLVAEMVAYQGNTIVFSEEGLAGARRRHARHLVDALAPHRVHVGADGARPGTDADVRLAAERREGPRRGLAGVGSSAT